MIRRTFMAALAAVGLFPVVGESKELKSNKLEMPGLKEVITTIDDKCIMHTYVIEVDNYSECSNAIKSYINNDIEGSVMGYCRHSNSLYGEDVMVKEVEDSVICHLRKYCTKSEIRSNSFPYDNLPIIHRFDVTHMIYRNNKKGLIGRAVTWAAKVNNA